MRVVRCEHCITATTRVGSSMSKARHTTNIDRRFDAATDPDDAASTRCIHGAERESAHRRWLMCTPAHASDFDHEMTSLGRNTHAVTLVVRGGGFRVGLVCSMLHAADTPWDCGMSAVHA